MGEVINDKISITNQEEISCCCDYLKLKIVIDNFATTKAFSAILEVLKVDIHNYDEIGQRGNYEYNRIYDANVLISWGGDYSKSNGVETAIIELKGQALREFEYRGGSYLNLCEVAINNNFKCLRFDFPTDLINSNLITKEALTSKYNWGEICSKMRSRGVDTSKRHNYIDDNALLQNKINGWSITYGGRSHKQICIYDKVLERKAVVGIDVECYSWIRFEPRFYHDDAHLAFLYYYAFLKDGRLNVFAKSLLNNLITFKTHNCDKKQIRARKIWKNWELFLDKVENLDLRVKSKYDVGTAIIKKRNWLESSVTRPMQLLYLASGGMLFSDIVKNLGSDKHLHDKSLMHSHIAAVNYYREVKGLGKITREEAVENLNNLALNAEFDESKGYVGLYIGKSLEMHDDVDYVDKLTGEIFYKKGEEI